MCKINLGKRSPKTPLVCTINFAVSREHQDYVKKRAAELKLKPVEFMRQMIENSMTTDPLVATAEERRIEQLEENHGWVAHIPGVSA